MKQGDRERDVRVIHNRYGQTSKMYVKVISEDKKDMPKKSNSLMNKEDENRKR